MADRMGDLIGFAYGEDLESLSQRSLGYRLLSPIREEPWCAEVEALARRLQATPYSDHWPPTGLFCSVLLADGRRLVALARYGLADHTPSQRRGGLELLGILAPSRMDVRSALMIYRWLEEQREALTDLHQFGNHYSSAEILASVAVSTLSADPIPVLPIRLWQQGVLLFAASSPSDSDHHLRLLEQATEANWQWLPLVGPDFPLQTYAQRGPLIAWTPHLAGVALKLDPKSSEQVGTHAVTNRRGLRIANLFLLVLLVGLFVANLWFMHTLRQDITAPQKEVPSPVEKSVTQLPPNKPSSAAENVARDRIVAALYELLIERGGSREWQAEKARLLARYERLVRTHPELRVREDSDQDKMTIAFISVLAERSADRIEEEVRKALSNKVFSEKLIKAVCEHLHDHFVSEMKDSP